MTLTQAASVTKRSLLAIVIFTILAIIGRIGLTYWNNYQLLKLPPKEERPENKFGALPAVNFPPPAVSSSNFSYSLDTTTGGLPQVPKLIKVYFIPQASLTLLAPERSKELAKKFGFLKDPELLSESEYRFINQEGRVLNLDLAYSNFKFTQTNTIASGSAQTSNALPTDPKIVTENFRNFLSVKNLLADELKTGRFLVVFDPAPPNKTTSAIINLWPEDFGGLPIITPSPNKALVWAVLTSGSIENSYSQINYTFWPVDKTTSSTYQIKTPETAFGDLQQGRGFITKEPVKSQVSISKVYLAYYQSESYAPYLQPVFVFEGPDFVGLVPAVTKQS